MSVNFSSKVSWEPIRSLAAGSIAAGYMGVGTAATEVVRAWILQNKTDEQLMFSFDGTEDHITLSAGESLIFDITSNKTNQENFFMEKGERLYVKRVGVATTGSVYFSVAYGGA